MARLRVTPAFMFFQFVFFFFHFSFFLKKRSCLFLLQYPRLTIDVCSMEMWCHDEIERDSWDWVEPPTREREHD